MYIINKNTQVIKSVQEGKYRSKILEGERVEYSTFTLEKIADYNCTKNGASLKGRFDTVIKILGSKSKLPIPVQPELGIFMVPTSSLKNSDCMLLAYYHVITYRPFGKFANIQFRDKSRLLINTSVKQFDLQIKRTSQVIAYFYWLSHFEH